MATAQDIRPRKDELAAQAQYLSTSPTASFHSPSSHGSALQRIIPVANAKHLKPFATEDIKVLLLENVNQAGRDILSAQGYQVEFLKSSLPEDQLIEKIRFGPPPVPIERPLLTTSGDTVTFMSSVFARRPSSLSAS